MILEVSTNFNRRFTFDYEGQLWFGQVEPLVPLFSLWVGVGGRVEPCQLKILLILKVQINYL